MHTDGLDTSSSNLIIVSNIFFLYNLFTHFIIILSYYYHFEKYTYSNSRKTPCIQSLEIYNQNLLWFSMFSISRVVDEVNVIVKVGPIYRSHFISITLTYCVSLVLFLTYCVFYTFTLVLLLTYCVFYTDLFTLVLLLTYCVFYTDVFTLVLLLTYCVFYKPCRWWCRYPNVGGGLYRISLCHAWCIPRTTWRVVIHPLIRLCIVTTSQTVVIPLNTPIVLHHTYVMYVEESSLCNK
jgi:hypothetical protein